MLQLIKHVLIFIGRPILYIFLILVLILFSSAKAFIRIVAFIRIAFESIRINKALTVFILSLFLSLLSITALWLYHYVFTDLPDVHLLTNGYKLPSTTKILDRNGILLYQLYQNHNRTPIQIDQLPAHVIYAHIAIEDQHFYKHPGINPLDISRATYKNIYNYFKCTMYNVNCNLSLQGASTITQQLIKNTLLTPQRSWKRKIQEAILAVQLEKILTKNQILEKYLNTVSYGGTAYGIETAARTYFAKPAADLNLAQSALLAGLPAAPTNYSPFGANPELATQRQQQVLQRMLQDNYITDRNYIDALNYRLTYAAPDTNIQAPHFVMYTRNQLENQLGAQLLTQGGLEITTTLDLDLQNFAQQILRNEIAKLQNLNVTNGAVLITKPATGEILAMVGSTDYFDLKNQGNVNATTALRQPGSAIKPVNYATALSPKKPTSDSKLETGNSKLIFTAATIINDSPVAYNLPGQPPYKPVNYDGRFHGRVSIRQALANSYNVPAVKILHSYGVDKMIDMGEALGIATWQNRDRYGLSLTLGGGEVTMTDMATVYGTFANLGHRVYLTPVLKIKNPNAQILNLKQLNNKTIEQSDNNPVLDPRVAFILNHILADNQARIPAFGRYSKLEIADHIVAVKTGTSNNLRDNWTIGYTPDYLVAVWVGNFDNTPMSRIASGITGATPIWNNIMTYLLNEYQAILPLIERELEEVAFDSKNNYLTKALEANEANFPWPVPPGLVKLPICPYASTLPCSGCPTREEWFIQGTQPTRHCSPFWFAAPTPDS